MRVDASTIYKKDIRYLKTLFNRLKRPDVLEPEQKFSITKSTGQNGVVTYKQTPTVFERAVYNKIIKTWIKATDALESTLRSLYNIVWSQCSKLIQNKLKTSSKFNDKTQMEM